MSKAIFREHKKLGLCVIALCVHLLPFCDLHAISISEKKAILANKRASITQEDGCLEVIQGRLKEKKEELLNLYIEANTLCIKNEVCDNEEFIEIRDDICAARRELDDLEQEWKKLAKRLAVKEDQALWHQPDTTIGQLVLDYGGSECIYLMPPEIAALRIHISSDILIPESSWNEMLELIFVSHGIGVKELHPFLRQLYFLKYNQSGLELITDDRGELDLLPPEKKVAFVFTPQPQEVKHVYHLLSRFVPQEQMTIQLMNGSIIVIGRVKEVLDLAKIYDFVSTPQYLQEWKLVVVKKARSEEVAKILAALFHADSSAVTTTNSSNFSGKINLNQPNFVSSQNLISAGSGSQQDSTASGFRVIPLAHPGNALFLIGKQAQIAKAEEIIMDIEKGIGQAQEKVIHWYACKHSDAQELAKVLSQVYTKLCQVASQLGNGQKTDAPNITNETFETSERTSSTDSSQLVVNPEPVTVVDKTKKRHGTIHENFIVDLKTNSIVMVIESFALTKLQELLKRIDVPKKMVQISTVLFEKRLTDSDQFGLNLLKLADAVTTPHATQWFWNDIGDRLSNKGILQYSMSRGSSHYFTKYDLTYKFLLSQSGLHINANPTVTTVNQTPTKISLVDEISINTGVVEIDTTNTTRLKDSFTRAQYGIIINITPTIHAKSEYMDDAQEVRYITLETDIVFDTTKPSVDNRPEVARRNIKNEVRIADGETVIIGGLRRKQSHNDRDYIPFLGELPGIGKLFSTTALSDSVTEMFIFITAKIIPDPKEEYYSMRNEELKKRAGDIPEYLQAIETAKENEKRDLFYHTVKCLTSE